MPLDVLRLEKTVRRFARLEQGYEEVGSSLGFDVSAHPDARSKVARDMQARLEADATEYASQLNSSTAARCLFALDAGRRPLHCEFRIAINNTPAHSAKKE